MKLSSIACRKSFLHLCLLIFPSDVSSCLKKKRHLLLFFCPLFNFFFSFLMFTSYLSEVAYRCTRVIEGTFVTSETKNKRRVTSSPSVRSVCVCADAFVQNRTTSCCVQLLHPGESTSILVARRTVDVGMWACQQLLGSSLPRLTCYRLQTVFMGCWPPCSSSSSGGTRSQRWDHLRGCFGGRAARIETAGTSRRPSLLLRCSRAGSGNCPGCGSPAGRDDHSGGVKGFHALQTLAQDAGKRLSRIRRPLAAASLLCWRWSPGRLWRSL